MRLNTKNLRFLEIYLYVSDYLSLYSLGKTFKVSLFEEPTSLQQLITVANVCFVQHGSLHTN